MKYKPGVLSTGNIPLCFLITVILKTMDVYILIAC